MSSCLSGRAYGFNLDNIVNSSSTTSRTSHSSSTLSESSNSLMAVSTRKPRTPRKRPNQTYNEAADLLSTACPTIFSTKNDFNKHSKLPKKHTYFFNEPPSELLLPFPGTERPIKLKPGSSIVPKGENSREIEFGGSLNCSSNSNSMETSEGYRDDLDTESMLDEDIEEGIDGIMGKSDSIVGNDEILNDKSCFGFENNYDTCYGYPLGLGFGGNLEFNFGIGLRNGVRALRNADEGNWWSFSSVNRPVPDILQALGECTALAVNVMNISPPPVSTISKKSPAEKKKKLEELMKSEPEMGNPILEEENASVENGPRLLLKLIYDRVLNAWSDKGSPLPEEMSGSSGSDIYARLAQIDLFSENGGWREASVIRYKEKRHTRLFSKKIRYQVRKVNADRRPRSKGRFVRRPNSPTCEEET